MDLDNVAGDLEGRDQPGQSGGKGRPVPKDNQQGHHPAREQDKPDLDKFAAKLGLVDDEPAPDDVRTDAPTISAPRSSAPQSSAPQSSAPRSSAAPDARTSLTGEAAKAISSLENAGRTAAAASLALTARTMRLAADLVDRLGDDVAPRGA